MGGTPDVDEGLVDRDLLDDGRGVFEDLHDVRREIEVSLEMPVDDDGLRAQPLGIASRHRRADPVGPGLVRRGKDDPSPDQDRLTLQGRVEELFDRGEERIEIGMENRRLSHAGQYARCLGHLIRPEPRSDSIFRSETLQSPSIDLAQMCLGKPIDEMDAAGMLVGLEMSEGPIGQLGLSDIRRHHKGDRPGQS